MTVLPEAIYRFDAIPPKYQYHFSGVKKKIKFIWNQKRAQIAKAMLGKKNKGGGITLPNLKL